MKKDIETRADIELLVNIFYGNVIADDLLGSIFQQIAKVNWPQHLGIMYNFWENIILYTGNYDGNPMNLHQNLHHIARLRQEHFDRWNNLFTDTVDGLFAGANASLAKQRSVSIAAVMREKLFAYRQIDG